MKTDAQFGLEFFRKHLRSCVQRGCCGTSEFSKAYHEGYKAGIECAIKVMEDLCPPEDLL